MEIKKVDSQKNLLSELKNNENNYVLIYKSGSEHSECAYNSLKKTKKIDGINIFSVDVSKVTDIHRSYNVTSAPTLLEFKYDKLIKDSKGCNTSNYFESLFQNSLFVTKENKNGKKQKKVTVYSTPSCPWCNKLKQYLRENKIRFNDIDVSKNQNAAQELIKNTGQQGVPQTNIDGKYIVGFDKKKIDKLLEIKTQ